MGTVGPLDCAGKRTVRGWMDVAQADPSSFGNAVVPPGLPSPWAACSVRTHCRRHGRATISTGLLPQGQPSSHALGLAVPTAPKSLMPAPHFLCHRKQAVHQMCPCHHVLTSEPPGGSCLVAASLCWPTGGS